MKQGFAYLKSSRMMYSRRTRMIMILKKPLLKIPTQNNFLYFLGHTLFLVCRREKKREFVFLFVFYREIFTAHFCFWRQILMTSKICKSALKWVSRASDGETSCEENGCCEYIFQIRCKTGQQENWETYKLEIMQIYNILLHINCSIVGKK